MNLFFCHFQKKLCSFIFNHRKVSCCWFLLGSITESHLEGFIFLWMASISLPLGSSWLRGRPEVYPLLQLWSKENEKITGQSIENAWPLPPAKLSHFSGHFWCYSCAKNPKSDIVFIENLWRHGGHQSDGRRRLLWEHTVDSVSEMMQIFSVVINLPKIQPTMLKLCLL